MGTGATLSSVFTRQTGAFYGSFSPWPLEPLGDEEAADLLQTHTTDPVHRQSTWGARRRVLIGLAAGSPRTLIALAQSCVEQPEARVAEHLQAVLRQSTAHYQMRFRTLNATGQRVVEQLTRAPGALSPKEVAAVLGADQKSIGVAMRRLLDEGVLTVRRQGRRARYAMAEPLFRYWYEYRSAPWGETRIGLIVRLLEPGAPARDLEDRTPVLAEQLEQHSAIDLHPELRSWRTLTGEPTQP